jgi:hypothetical protein
MTQSSDKFSDTNFILFSLGRMHTCFKESRPFEFTNPGCCVRLTFAHVLGTLHWTSTSNTFKKNRLHIQMNQRTFCQSRNYGAISTQRSVSKRALSLRTSINRSQSLGLLLSSDRHKKELLEFLLSNGLINTFLCQRLE